MRSCLGDWYRCLDLLEHPEGALTMNLFAESDDAEELGYLGKLFLFRLLGKDLQA